MWNIKRIISKGDYNYCLVPEHPNATANGYVLEHRVLMENHLGRLLDAEEIVHHIDGNKKNNAIDNLEVMDRKIHNTIHSLSVGRMYTELICPACGKSFIRVHNRTHLSKGGRVTLCSRECSGKFKMQERLFGLTAEMKSAISVNIVRIFRKFTTTPSKLEITGCVETIRRSPENGEDIVQPTTGNWP